MPRNKKEVKLKLHVPGAEHREEFQQQINEAYIEMIKNYINTLPLEKEQKKKVIIEIMKKM